MRFYTFLFLFLLGFVNYPGQAQTSIPERTVVFQNEQVPRIDITVPADSLMWLLDPANAQNNLHIKADFIFSVNGEKDTILNIGFRIRGNTSRTSQKKSWKISFNTFESGRKFHGLEKMNLNGEHNDPTLARSVIGWDLLRAMKIPGSRANHIELYINGAYLGLYANIEHVDEEFVKLRFGNKNGNLYKCLWPASLDYIGQNPNVYAQLNAGGRPAYELLTNSDNPDFSDLAHFIDVLNNTSLGNLPCALEPIFNVDAFLKTYAFEILIGHWDNYAYNQNNYYLYKNTDSGKFEYIPYDFDNTLGIDWLNKDWDDRPIYNWAKFPLCQRLLEVPRYRERFSYFINALIQNQFDATSLFPHIDSLQAKIRPFAVNDAYRVLDYGFTMNDFDENFEMGLADFFQTKWGIKEFLTLRTASALNQLDAIVERPQIQASGLQTVTQWTQMAFKIQIVEHHLMDSVRIGLLGAHSSGGTLFQRLYDDGQHNDGFAQDGIYGFNFPFLAETIKNQAFYLQIYEKTGSLLRFPACGFDTIFVTPGQNKIFINEIMAKNSSILADEVGEYDDWIELFIPGGQNLSTENFYLTDNENQPDKWALPNLDASGYLLFWADDSESQGAHHTNFKLSGSGEFVGLFEKMPNGTFLQHDGLYYYTQQEDIAFARLPNGLGAFNEAAPSPLSTNHGLVKNTSVFEQQHGLDFFPNPSSGLFYLKNKSGALHFSSLQIRNQLGQIVFIDTNFSPNTVVDLSTFPDGVYWAKTEDGTFLGKIVKLK